jgi:hypothetical protein
VALISALQQTLSDASTVTSFRVLPKDFTRQRTLTFKMVTLLILQGHKQALQNTLNKCFKAMGLVHQVPTASALCQARQKLKPELFLHLNGIVTQHFYQLPTIDCSHAVKIAMKFADQDPDGKLLLPRTPCEPETAWNWLGHRVLGIDGTRWNLPDTPANRDHFGSAKNQHDPIGVAQGHGSVLYDVLNDIGISAVLEPIQAEKDLMFKHLKDTQPGDVIVLDRGYAAYCVLAFWAGNGRHFVVRLPRTTFNPAREFWNSPARDAVVTLNLTPDQRAFVQEHQLPRQLQVRLVKVTLSTGEEEVLATSLLESQRYSAEEIGQLYAWRWRTETYIDRLKNIFEIERLGAKRREHLQQDFYGVVFLATLESVLSREANRQLDNESRRRGTRYVKQVNRAVSYSALLNDTLILLSNPKRRPEKILSDLCFLFKTNPVLRRPGRSYERERRTFSKKLRYHRYTKRSLT